MTNDWYLARITGSSYSYFVKKSNVWTDNRGLNLWLKVDGSSTETQMPETGNLVVGEITVSVSSELIPNSDYINIIHTVENKGTQPHDIKMRIRNDLMINRVDVCDIHNLEGHKGVEFQANPVVRFILKHSPKVTDVDTYSYCGCPGWNWNGWNNCTDWSDRNADNQIIFSWQNQTIPANSIQTFRYSIGIGEYNATDEVKQIDDNKTKNQSESFLTLSSLFVMINGNLFEWSKL